MTATLELERRRRDARLAEAQALEARAGSSGEEPMAEVARAHVARLRAYIAQGRVRALEAGAHPNKPCGEPVYASGGR